MHEQHFTRKNWISIVVGDAGSGVSRPVLPLIQLHPLQRRRSMERRQGIRPKTTGWRDECFPDFLRSDPGDQTSGGMCKSPGSVLQLQTGSCPPSGSLGALWRRTPRGLSAPLGQDSTSLSASITARSPAQITPPGSRPLLQAGAEWPVPRSEVPSGTAGLALLLTSRTLASHLKPMALAHPLSLS